MVIWVCNLIMAQELETGKFWGLGSQPVHAIWWVQSHWETLPQGVPITQKIATVVIIWPTHLPWVWAQTQKFIKVWIALHTNMSVTSPKTYNQCRQEVCHIPVFLFHSTLRVWQNYPIFTTNFLLPTPIPHPLQTVSLCIHGWLSWGSLTL